MERDSCRQMRDIPMFRRYTISVSRSVYTVWRCSGSARVTTLSRFGKELLCSECQRTDTRLAQPYAKVHLRQSPHL